MPVRSILLLLLLIVEPLVAQTPQQRFLAAKKVVEKHSEPDGFGHDGSTEGKEALSGMWRASADAVIDALRRNSTTTPKALEKVLCGLEPDKADECLKYRNNSVIQLSPGLFAVALSTGEMGTVFLVGQKDRTFVRLWDIEDARSQAVDREDLIGAWRLDRATWSCRDNGSSHKPGSCGPLYASLIALPADSQGRARFVIDAGYTQIMGATIAKQTSIWQWNGNDAELLWIEQYGYMIEQKTGSSFASGILNIGQKHSFRTFTACGSCEERQMLRRVRVSPDGMEDLGLRTQTAELDLIDELFWRVFRKRPVAGIASPQVASVLTPQLLRKEESSANGDYLGMLMDSSVSHKGNKTHVCIAIDDFYDGAAMNFVIFGKKITAVRMNAGLCAK